MVLPEPCPVTAHLFQLLVVWEKSHVASDGLQLAVRLEMVLNS